MVAGVLLKVCSFVCDRFHKEQNFKSRQVNICNGYVLTVS